jgi:hypothetical protein
MREPPFFVYSSHAIRHQGMTKKKVLQGLRRVIKGNTGKTSEVVREFKQYPQFQQCCHILSQALQHNTIACSSFIPAGLPSCEEPSAGDRHEEAQIPET